MRLRLLGGLSLTLIGAAAGVLHGGLAAQSPAQPETWQVFERVAAPSPGSETRTSSAVAGSMLPVTVRFDRLTQAAQVGGTINIPLPNGTTARAAIVRSQLGPNQTFITGPLVDGEPGEASLTALGDTLAGRVVVGSQLFMLRRLPDSTVHVVEEINPSALPPDDPMPMAELPPDPTDLVAGGGDTAPIVVGGDTTQFVDTLIVYTPAARAAAGGTAQINALAINAVNNANTALVNAGVSTLFRLVDYEEVNYTETGNTETDLNRLIAVGDGHMDTVHALRDTYHADTVTLLANNSDWCGIAPIMTPSSTSVSAFQHRAFNVVYWLCADANLDFGHETGHNMGLVHNRANATDIYGNPSTPALPYGYGYRVDYLARDVMAYDLCSGCSPRRTIYSTPLHDFPGTGTPAGTPDDDAARAIAGTAPVVANFRDSTCSYSISPTSAIVGQNGTYGTINVTTGSSCAWSAITNSAPFLTISGKGLSITGSRSFTYIVSSNSGNARTGTLTVAGQTITIQQSEYVEAPKILEHPKNQAVNLGGTVYMSVIATGGGVLKYDWRKNGVSLYGETAGPSLWIENAQNSNAGTYTVVVSNAAGSVTSNGATVSINVAPAVTSHPQSQTVNPGTDVTFNVTATGTAPLSYYWRKNGSTYRFTTTPSLTISAVTGSDAGTYDVLVSNVAGEATSTSATLQVNSKVQITTHPASQSVAAGGSATFTVAATGTAPLTYAWKKDGTVISGATSATLTLSGVGAADAGVYTAVVSNVVGSVTANAAVLAVPGTWLFTTLAGQAGVAGATDGTGSAATFNYPKCITLDTSGNLYVTTAGAIRKVTPAGVVTTVGPQATCATIDSAGTLYYTRSLHDVWSYSSAGVSTRIAGNALTGPGHADGTGSAASFYSPWSIVRDPSSGNLFVADYFNNTIRKITPATVVTTIAGDATKQGVPGVDGTGTAALFERPAGLARDASGNLYVADQYMYSIRKISPSNVVTTLAGGGDGHPGVVDAVGSAARFNVVSGVAVDSSGNVYVAEEGSSLIRKITPAGAVSTLGGVAQTSGSADGIGNVVRFASPQGIAVDSSGTLYIADTYNHTVRKGVQVAAPTITTQPTAQTATVGSGPQVPFSVVATGTGPLKYQWQLSTDSGSTWTDVQNAPFASERYSNATTATVLIGVHDVLQDRMLLRCVVSNSGGFVISDPAMLLVNGPPVITANPSWATVAAGNEATFSATAAGSGLGYRWQVSPTGSTWSSLTDDSTYIATSTPTLHVLQTPADLNGYWYRVVVTNSYGSATSSVVKLTVTAGLTITSHPADALTTVGGNAQFAVAVNGSSPSYQWQVSSDGGYTWSDVTNSGTYSGATAALLAITGVSSTLNGAQYRSIASNSQATVTSHAATLTALRPMNLSPAALIFSATKAGAAGALASVTPGQTVTVSFTDVTSEWTVTADQPWVAITSGSGSGAGTFTVGIVNPDNVLGASTNVTARLTVTPSNPAVQTAVIPVTLTVQLTTASSASAFGAFDTPADGATGVVGAIPVTGWALDDVGVQRVEIWRNCVEAIDRAAGACAAAAPGGAANFVFIGRTAFLAGARPDVEVANPSTPVAYRAGWGYLMLTNALPHVPSSLREGGQGTFTLSAYAVDVEGHYTRLGTKTITLDNDHATIPFGAIDTPTQGGTIPETSAPFNNANAYPNFGWAMTQIGKCIDTASTLSYKVYIDGVSRTLTPGVNWFPSLNRSDIAAAYPGYCNTTNALAAYYINADALGLANGLHTIGWDVIDNQGHVAGIGSRFFLISR